MPEETFSRRSAMERITFFGRPDGRTDLWKVPCLISLLFEHSAEPTHGSSMTVAPIAFSRFHPEARSHGSNQRSSNPRWADLLALIWPLSATSDSAVAICWRPSSGGSASMPRLLGFRWKAGRSINHGKVWSRLACRTSTLFSGGRLTSTRYPPLSGLATRFISICRNVWRFSSKSSDCFPKDVLYYAKVEQLWDTESFTLGGSTAYLHAIHSFSDYLPFPTACSYMMWSCYLLLADSELRGSLFR